jgi:hypothetical protein
MYGVVESVPLHIKGVALVVYARDAPVLDRV